jgi:hypothetical protein
MSPEQKENSQELNNLVLTSEETPFKTKQAAGSAMTQKNLKDTHEIIEYGDGYALAPIEPGPVSTPPEKPVKKGTEPQQKPEATENTTTPVKSIEEYTEEELLEIARKKTEARIKKEEAENNTTEKYWWVIFQDRTDKNQQIDVWLAVNGIGLTFQRDVETIVPQSYLEASDHGTHAVYEQKPGMKRKITGHVKTFPYNRIRPATESDFHRMRKEGNKKALENYARYGTERPPEQIQ